MKNRDFIDKDLTSAKPPSSSRSAPVVSRDNEEIEENALDLSVLARHRKEIDEQSVLTTEELEKLRRKEEDLQRRKRELEDARRKHDEYFKGKEEILSRLSQSLVGIERQEIRAEQTAQLLNTTRTRFRELLEGLRELHDEDWPEEEMHARLTEALATIDDARMEYNKATARIEALLDSPENEGGVRSPVLFEEPDMAGHFQERSFWEWMGIGFAFSLPLLLVLVALGLVIILQFMGLL